MIKSRTQKFTGNELLHEKLTTASSQKVLGLLEDVQSKQVQKCN